MRLARVLVLSFLASALAACGGDGGPVGPDTRVEMDIVAGDNQFAPASATLPDPLQVVVRAVADGLPEKDRTVRWQVVSGSGASLDAATTVTDERGFASVSATLGPELGEYHIRASVLGQDDAFVEFVANAVRPPELSLVPASASAGDVIEIQGSNFSPTPRHNTVLFAGVPGQVLTSQATSLTVRVPDCLPSLDAEVVVQLGEASSAPRPMSVTAKQEGPPLAVGEDALLSGSDGFLCVGFGAGGAQTGYLAVVQSASEVGAARFDFQVLGLTGEAATTAPGAESARAAVLRHDRVAATESGPWRAEWERALRAREARAVADRAGAARSARVDAARTARTPAVGDRRDFDVLGFGGQFTRVTGEVRAVTEQAELYVDVSVLADLPDATVELLGTTFDDPIFPVVTDAYGEPSDLDGNGKVIVLFTPVVNGLTPRGSPGFAAGFFFGLDLLVDEPNSNRGEIFYLMVPDPDGEFSDEQTVEDVERVLPAILAHEFQHMIHFNQRVLKLGAKRTDALWLSEALAHTSEDVVGEHFAALGDAESALLFQAENFGRAGLFLEAPANTSVIVAAGQASLEERGAGWLLIRYLEEHSGGADVLRRLTQTTLTGVDNVTAAAGLSWPDLMSDWAAAVGMEARSPDERAAVREALHYPVLDLVDVILRIRPVFPLQPMERGAVGFVSGGRLWSSSSAYFFIEPSPSGLALAVLGARGRPPSAEAALQLQIVRLF